MVRGRSVLRGDLGVLPEGSGVQDALERTSSFGSVPKVPPPSSFTQPLVRSRSTERRTSAVVSSNREVNSATTWTKWTSVLSFACSLRRYSRTFRSNSSDEGAGAFLLFLYMGASLLPDEKLYYTNGMKVKCGQTNYPHHSSHQNQQPYAR